MDRSVVINVKKDVLSAGVSGERVLLDPDSGTYFSLNEVGARIWELALEGLCFGDVVDRLAAEYDAGAERLAADAERLLHELAALKLVTLAGAGPDMANYGHR